MAFDSSTSPLLTTNSVSGDSSLGLQASENLIAQAEYGLETRDGGAGGQFEIRTVGNLLSLATLSTTGLIVMTNPGDASGLVTAVVEGNDSILIDDGEAVGGSVTISVVPSTTQQLHQTQVDGVDIGVPYDTINFVSSNSASFEGSDGGTKANITVNVQNLASTDGYFVITQADETLPNATDLGALDTGLVYSTMSGDISTLSTTTEPAMSGVNINASSIPVASVVGTAVNITDAQTISGSKTFTSTIVASAMSVVSGTIDMNSHKIVNVTDPTDDQDAATKAYVDASAGSPATWAAYPAVQDVDMDGFAITNLASPSADYDAATKLYVDGQNLNNPMSVTTESDTATTLASITVTEDSSITITGSFASKGDATSDTSGGSFFASAYNDGGTVTVTGTPFIVNVASSTQTFDIVASGDRLIIEVTGLVDVPINWSGYYVKQTQV